ncbi:peptidyl-prolyl cis-trans isomerase [Malaciobacter pacificus]|uniref:Peptidyl-prolyl cis-trans isomerase n=1 Tax=Malaciobacter pacificus TaxID=1080223 RepID=A0A5C2H8D7_9BACT|nr:peptidylprolyl isomerase [Malaciobacter pacificus]QEP35230.1 peptidyl-prolyl cis-trans isomerase B [Malaciobacter pacificus]GGD44727.1 peptidyl-prolyl cis-trans isomerase [Malaciobacter pacificus]
MFGRKLKEYNIPREELEKFNYAKITTDSGIIWLKLFNKETPIAVSNFATLANDGFYDNLNFHRVIPGFMAQGGCPDGTGMGNPGWAIKCETDAEKQVHKRGSLSMAHAGKDTGGSQFFICFVPSPHLDGGHTVFGEIEENDSESFSNLDKITTGTSIINIKILEKKN